MGFMHRTEFLLPSSIPNLHAIDPPLVNLIDVLKPIANGRSMNLGNSLPFEGINRACFADILVTHKSHFEQSFEILVELAAFNQLCKLLVWHRICKRSSVQWA